MDQGTGALDKGLTRSDERRDPQGWKLRFTVVGARKGHRAQKVFSLIHQFSMMTMR
jgi:hypothetical protein